jgi:UDP-N-acetylmuramyl pentapeptide phosphotransferase/UDP-N-acetylglucosamine-1-phosphate transferase
MIEILGWPVAISGLLAFLFVGLVRRLALRHGVMDHPGERSSHSVVTPRGGGLGLLLAGLGLWLWRAIHPLSWSVLVGIAGTSSVALVGWMDDRAGLPVRTRLATHILAAAALGALAATGASSAWIALGVFSWWTFWTVSSINLVNFMDGINGLVACQIAVFAFSLALFPLPGTAMPFYALTIAAACVGFLPWNFPRARIFMGDVGSGALGYLVPLLALMAMRASGIDIVRAHLPLLPLFGDATWTILRRWRNGERLTVAHRSHLYQRLANGGMGHTSVTLIYTIAAAAGAVVAHLGPLPGTAIWALGYAALTLLVGFLLHRRIEERAHILT